MSEPAADQLSLVRQLKTQNQRLEREVAALQHGGGSGTLPPVDIVDAKIDAAEARTDTKFATLRGDLAAFATKGTVWGAMATALGIVLAALALGANRFDAGVTAGGALAPFAADQKRRDAEQDAKLDEILRRLPAKPAGVYDKRTDATPQRSSGE